MSSKRNEIIEKKMWAYYSPDGYVQVRSIAFTKSLCREAIAKLESFTYSDYEKKGYAMKRVVVTINPL